MSTKGVNGLPQTPAMSLSHKLHLAYQVTPMKKYNTDEEVYCIRKLLLDILNIKNYIELGIFGRSGLTTIFCFQFLIQKLMIRLNVLLISRVFNWLNWLSDFCFQALRGLEYFANNKLVHKDVAARNFLLTSDLVVKLSCASLCKDVYRQIWDPPLTLSILSS